MKKYTTRFLSVLLCMLMVLTSVGVWTTSVAAAGATIYVSNSGNDDNDGSSIDKAVKSLVKAATLAGKDGKVIVTDSVDIGTTSVPGTTITGLNSNSVINVTAWCFQLSGPTTFENITLNAKVAWSYILAHGHKLVIGDGVNVTADPGITTALSIRGGAEGKLIDGSTEIIVKSGAWNNVVGGTRNNDVMGNSHITIYDTAMVLNVNLGIERAEGNTNTLKGSGTLKLVGKASPVSNKITTSTVDSNVYLDVTEYDGPVADGWRTVGFAIVEDAAKLPEDAKPVSAGGVVGVPGRTFITVEEKKDVVLSDVKIYLSEAGSDTNDGSSIASAVKTLTRACELAGATGTVIVADSYKQAGSEKISCGKLEGLSDSCVFEIASWAQFLGADCTIDNLTIKVSYNWAFILCNGFKLTVGENVKVVKDGAATVFLSIRGGGEGSSVSGSTDITLKGGTWQTVAGGTKNGSVSGNTKITVYPGVTIANISAGNDGTVEGNAINGTGTIKVVGASNDIGKIGTTPIVKGGLILDVSEYTGSDKEALVEKAAASGYSIKRDASSEVEVVAPPEEPEVTAPTTGTVTDVVPGEGVIYLSDNGSNSNDGKTSGKPVASLETAIALGGKSPTIVIVDQYTSSIVKALPGCNIVGQTSDSKFIIDSWAFMLGGKTTFDNITVVANKDYSYILCMTHPLIIEKGVKTVKADGVKTLLGIRGGGEGNVVNSPTNITIRGGEWNDVHGGTRQASVYGNTYVTVCEPAKVASLNIGNNGVKDGNEMKADGVIRLVGNVTAKITAKPDYQDGDMYLDLTEFTGTQDAAWAGLGANIITDKAALPKFISDAFGSATGEYDVSGIEKFRYISDSGDDANDGLTKDKPMKTMAAAINSMGAGGTLIVTGKFTLNEVTAGLPAYNLTSTSEKDVFDFTFWALWTNNTEIYNLNIQIGRNYNFILHQGTPLKIGSNVKMEFVNGANVNLSIRGNESGDVPMTDITIESGAWSAIHTGTKKDNLLGNSKVKVLGGTVETISVGNDGAEGRILGNVEVILEGKPGVNHIIDKGHTDGYATVDLSKFEGRMPTIASTLSIKTEESENYIPLNKAAVFINGYPDGTFLPEKVMTRAEAITVVSKIAGLTSIYTAPEATAFTDLAATDWYATNVKYLESFGALGFWGTTLNANSGITRAEFVKLISGIVEKVEGDAPAFSDVPETHAYYNEIIAAAKAGLVTGYPDGTFLPDNTLKRSEIVTILNRLTKRNIVTSNTEKITKFTDIAGHWAAPQIIAASCTPITDGIIVWYAGDVMSANSPVDKSTLDLSTTAAVLAGVDTTNAQAVADAVEAYAVKRRAEIANTPTSVSVTGTKYYVAADGNDANDGKSPETAWKSIAKVNEYKFAEGDGVFFKRGDLFRGRVTTQKGVTYSAYGEGEKPKIYGSAKNYANIGYWQKTTRENIYVSTDVFTEDVGLIVFNEGEAWSDKQILGVKGFMGALTKDLQMYHDTNDKKVYLYSESDPNTRWSSIEIAPGAAGFSGNGNNVTIDNICLKYVGAHGIGYSDGTTGLTVQNCEIGWIGGKIQNGTTRYGNAVEIYIGCKDYTVTNCHIYQVYDAGVTHQYFQTRDGAVNMENVKYTDNVIEYCTYNIEYVNAQSEDKGVMKDIEISGNLLIHGGEGWGQQRPDGGEAVIKGWSLVNHGVNYLIYDNVISTANPNSMLIHMAVAKYSFMPELYGNLFIAQKNSFFGIYDIGTIYTKRKYDEKLTDTAIGLDDNTMIYLD